MRGRRLTRGCRVIKVGLALGTVLRDAGRPGELRWPFPVANGADSGYRQGRATGPP